MRALGVGSDWDGPERLKGPGAGGRFGLVRGRVVIELVSAVVALAVLTGTAAGELQRTLNGPATVRPGHVYTFSLAGFVPGEEVYPTVQPVACARRSERCEQDPCPACAVTKVGANGTALVRFRWPHDALYVIANMSFKHPRWRRGSSALVRIDVASTRVPRGCQRMPSITANSQAGSIVCAATIARIG